MMGETGDLSILWQWTVRGDARARERLIEEALRRYGPASVRAATLGAELTDEQRTELLAEAAVIVTKRVDSADRSRTARDLTNYLITNLRYDLAKRWKRWLDEGRHAGGSLDAPLGEDGEATVGDTLEAEGSDPAATAPDGLLAELVMDRLTPTEARAIQQRHGYGLTDEEAAGMEGISLRRWEARIDLAECRLRIVTGGRAVLPSPARKPGRHIYTTGDFSPTQFCLPLPVAYLDALHRIAGKAGLNASEYLRSIIRLDAEADLGVLLVPMPEPKRAPRRRKRAA